MLAIDSGYSVWIDWFERRIRGEDAAFAIPGDKRRKEDKAILRKLADATDEDFWSKGAPHVNATLQQWLDEARARAAANNETDKAEIARKLERAASPQARITAGKLDAGPNQTYDQPRFSGNLADLPEELLSFLGVLARSLGPQASPFMRESLAEYRNELLVRGNRPILGILKGLASAIARELWTPESMRAVDDPVFWELRDNREWDGGTADLFRTFFKHHNDLIAHFPLDAEREELLASITIDEEAATGQVLVEPVETVLQEVVVLHRQGMSTDDLIRIMTAQARYMRNIASLPPPEGGTPPTEVITAKRRHVLMTTGFYLDLYSVLGSTASLAPYAPVLLTKVQAAAQSLLALVR